MNGSAATEIAWSRTPGRVVEVGVVLGAATVVVQAVSSAWRLIEGPLWGGMLLVVATQGLGVVGVLAWRSVGRPVVTGPDHVVPAPGLGRPVRYRDVTAVQVQQDGGWTGTVVLIRRGSRRSRALWLDDPEGLAVEVRRRAGLEGS